MCQETCTLANTCGFVAATHRLSNGRRDSVADNRRRAASAGASSWNCRGEPVNSVALNRGRAREPRGSSRRDYPSEGRRPRTRVSPSASCFFFSPLRWHSRPRALKPEHGDRDAVAAEGKLSPGSPSSYVYARPPAQPAVDILTPRTSRSNCERPILAATSGLLRRMQRASNGASGVCARRGPPRRFILSSSSCRRIGCIRYSDTTRISRVFTAFGGKHREDSTYPF